MKCWVFLLSCAVMGPAEAAANSVDELIRGIAENEKVVLNLRVEAEWSALQRRDDEEKWEDAGDGKVTAWLLGMPGSKFRAETEDRTPWVGGPVPFAQTKMVRAFDGRSQQFLYWTRGVPRPAGAKLRGQIVAERMIGFNDFASGWKMSIYGVTEGMGPKPLRFSEYLTEVSTLSGMSMDVSTTRVGERECLQLTISRSGQALESYVLDHERGFALVEKKVFYSNGAVMYRVQVTGLLEAAPGVFYPSKAIQVSYRDTGREWAKLTYEAMKAVANDPKFSDEVFKIIWPHGTIIEDQISGTVFTVGYDEKELLKEINNQVNMAAELATTAPATASSSCFLEEPDERLPRDAERETSVAGEEDIHATAGAGGRTSAHFVWVLVGVAVGLALFLLLWRWKGRRQRSSSDLPILLVVLGMILSGMIRGDAHSVGVDELGQQRVFNCGVYSSLFLLRYLDVDVDVASLAADLEVGSHWELQANLLNIKRALQRRGLRVEGYGKATLSEVLDRADDRSPWLVHIQDGELAHFLIVLKTSACGVLCVDSGKHVRWLRGKELRDLHDAFSGYCLLVSSSVRNSDDHGLPVHVLDGNPIAVDMGDVDDAQGPLVVTVRVRNPRERPLPITSVKGDCGCLTNVELDGATPVKLDAKQEGILKFFFDRRRFGTGKIKRRVALQVDENGQDKWIEIVIAANVHQVPAENQLRWFPEQIDLGIARSPRQFGEPQVVTVLVPNGIAIKEAQTSSPVLMLSRVDDGGDRSDPKEVVFADRPATRVTTAVATVRPDRRSAADDLQPPFAPIPLALLLLAVR